MPGLRVAVIGAIALLCATRAVGAEDTPVAAHIAVAVCDLETVSPSLLVAAEQVASDVYRDIGIEVDWIENGCDQDGRALAVSLIPRAMADIDVSDLTLGFANSRSSQATVLYDRVQSFAHRYRMRHEVLLGYVIAHELGHLLLPPKSHSPAGLMRATIDIEMASARRLRFTGDQGALIAARVKDAPGYTAAARPQNCCDARRAPSAMAASLPQTTSGSTAAWPTQVP